MLRTPPRRAVLLAAGALIVALAACDSGDPDDDAGKDLAGNRAGAMAQYKVGDQFTATEPLSFSILYNNHPNYPLNENWLMWTELTKRTNVKLEPVAVPLSDYEQKRSLLIGAGDAPFIIPKTYHPQENTFVSSGAILPVSDYIDLMPNLKDKIAKWSMKPEMDSLRQADGKYYLLPGLHEKAWQDYSIAMRTDVLQQLGLQVPKTWDDLYTVLKAMKAAHPDTYPFSDRFSKPTPGGNLLNIVTKSYGTYGGWDYQHATWNESAKKYEYTGATPQYKQAVEYLHKLVSEGLQLVARSRHQRELVTAAGELPGDVSPDPAGGASDDCDVAWFRGRKTHGRNILGAKSGLLVRLPTGRTKSEHNLVKNVRRISGSRGEHDTLLI